MASKFLRRPALAAALVDDGTPSVPVNLFGLTPGRAREIEIDLDKVQLGVHQPRISIDDEGITALAASIEKDGLLYPILVRKGDGRKGDGDYVVVGGERRVRACRKLGWTTIFARVVKGDPDEIALIDNLQRTQLNAIETARSLAGLRDTHAYTQEQLGDVVGMNRVAITRLLGVLSLPAAILEDYLAVSERVTRSALEEIAAAPAERQIELWGMAKGGATVREIKDQKRGEPKSQGIPEISQVIRKSVAGITKHLDALATASLADIRFTLSEEERSRLADLRRRIDEMLSGE